MFTLRSVLPLAVTLALGCGSGPLAPVRGKVSYKGTPLRAGSIVFTPDPQRGTGGPLAQAEIQSDGTYLLRTGDAVGAAAGWHRVTVVAVEAALPGASAGPYPVPRSLLPEKYRDPELSGLSCEVKAAQENKIDFNLD
jgi:hypothetical protein